MQLPMQILILIQNSSFSMLFTMWKCKTEVMGNAIPETAANAIFHSKHNQLLRVYTKRVFDKVCKYTTKHRMKKKSSNQLLERSKNRHSWSQFHSQSNNQIL